MTPLATTDGSYLVSHLVARASSKDDLPPMVFPNTGLRALSTTVHLLGVSLLTYCIARRVDIDGVRTLKDIRKISLPRILLTIVFADSWLFVFFGGILAGGEGLGSPLACTFAIWICIAFYVTTKIFIYWFLVERVHVVWAPISGMDRRHSRIYKICFAAMTLYVVFFILAITQRVAHVRPDGQCIIGVHPLGTIPVIIYDLILNLFLACLFVWPLWKANITSPALRYVATRTLIATLVALASSIANLSILTILHGHEPGWICLASCGLDVSLNAVILYWATGGVHESLDTSFTPSLPSITTRQGQAPMTVQVHLHDELDLGVRSTGGTTTALSSSLILSGVIGGAPTGGIHLGDTTQSDEEVEKMDDMKGFEDEGMEVAVLEKGKSAEVPLPMSGKRRERIALPLVSPCAKCSRCACWKRCSEGDSSEREEGKRSRRKPPGGLPRRSSRMSNLGGAVKSDESEKDERESRSSTPRPHRLPHRSSSTPLTSASASPLPSPSATPSSFTWTPTSPQHSQRPSIIRRITSGPPSPPRVHIDGGPENHRARTDHDTCPAESDAEMSGKRG